MVCFTQRSDDSDDDCDGDDVHVDVQLFFGWGMIDPSVYSYEMVIWSVLTAFVVLESLNKDMHDFGHDMDRLHDLLQGLDTEDTCGVHNHVPKVLVYKRYVLIFCCVCVDSQFFQAHGHHEVHRSYLANLSLYTDPFL